LRNILRYKYFSNKLNKTNLKNKNKIMENFWNREQDIQVTNNVPDKQLTVAELMWLDQNSEVVIRFNENMELVKNQVNKITHLNETLLKLDIQENQTNQLAELLWSNQSMDYVNFQDKTHDILEEIA